MNWLNSNNMLSICSEPSDLFPSGMNEEAGKKKIKTSVEKHIQCYGIAHSHIYVLLY